MSCDDDGAFVAPLMSMARLRTAAASLALAVLTLSTSPPPCRADSVAPQVSTTRRAVMRRRRAGTPAVAVPRWMGTEKPTSEEEQAAAAARRAASEARRRVAREAVAVFESRYVDTDAVPWTRVRRRIERAALRTDAELASLVRWALGCANDAYTRYLPARELDGVRDGIEGAMMGVGIVFSAETRGWRRAQRVIVKHVVRGSPAHDAGLQRGDEIVAIDTHRVTTMRVDDAAARLAARRRGRVLLTFVRRAEAHAARAELSVMLTRRRFAVPTVAHELVHVPALEGHVAFLQVRDFAARTAKHARAALKEIARADNVNALVIDLRGNAGGLVDQAVEFAKLLLPHQRVVVAFVGRSGATSAERTARTQPVLPKGIPVLVLADERTASASELVMAALRDNCVAVTVGTRTFGKGSVQAVVPLSDGAGVAVTVAAYRTPAGKRIADGNGLRPDWFRSDLADDAHAVTQLLKRAPARRLRWVRTRLNRCVPPSTDIELQLRRPPAPWWQFWRRFGGDG